MSYTVTVLTIFTYLRPQDTNDVIASNLQCGHDLVNHLIAWLYIFDGQMRLLLKIAKCRSCILEAVRYRLHVQHRVSLHITILGVHLQNLEELVVARRASVQCMHHRNENLPSVKSSQ